MDLPKHVANPPAFKLWRIERWWFRREVESGRLKPWEEVSLRSVWGLYWIHRLISELVAVSVAIADGCTHEWSTARFEEDPLGTRLLALFVGMRVALLIGPKLRKLIDVEPTAYA